MKTFFKLVVVFLTVFSLPIFAQNTNDISGAWHVNDSGTEHLVLFQDGYVTHTVYDDNRFIMSHGGAYTVNDQEIKILVQFNSYDKTEVGKTLLINFDQSGDGISLDHNGEGGYFTRIDDAVAPLAGVWQITDRMEDGKLVPIQRSGTRKTLKILTGTRFQWIAIDPAVALFAGTGGGTYSFKDGKYIENIEYFSRDDSRVGASLHFDAKLEDGKWHHSGLSSKGDKIYEVWGK